jgi:hypothetical protein
VPDGERITLEFVALADDVPAAVRVRSLLKRALRSFRLECVRVVGLPESWDDPPAMHQLRQDAAAAGQSRNQP